MTTSNFNTPSFTLNSSGSINSSGTSQTTTGFYITPQPPPRSISITPVANGYSVSIGCQTFVFENIISMLSRIEEYYDNPSEIEDHFIKNKKLPVLFSNSKKTKN